MLRVEGSENKKAEKKERKRSKKKIGMGHPKKKIPKLCLMRMRVSACAKIQHNHNRSYVSALFCQLNNNNNKNNIYRGYHQANTKLIRVVLYLHYYNHYAELKTEA